MSDLLTIGTSGIRAYSRALSTVSDNIANVGTAGYSRRTVQMQEARASGDLVLYRNNIRPGGVGVVGVVRAVDEWLVQDSRLASSDAGRYAARTQWMEVTEAALDDGADGVGVNMTAIFNAADRLSANPSDATLRSGFLQAVDNTATAFRRAASSLANSANGVAASAQTATTSVNSDLVALQRVNEGLLRSRDGSTNQATLLDERDRLIDNISSQMGVTASFDAHGVASLRSSGPGGEVLLDGSNLATLSVTTAPSGQISYGIAIGSGPSAAFTPLTGTLAGLSDASANVATRRTELDTLANDFATSMNTQHQAGLDANGNPGVALFTIGAGAATLAAVSLGGSQVAAADGSSVNGNILSFAGLRGAGGSEANWAAMVAAQAQTTSAARAQDAAATTRLNNAYDARSEVSAIDLDQEAAELIRYQQAYDAAAKTIQVARETMQTIMNIF